MSEFVDVSQTANKSFEFGKWISSPPPGEDVVITGLSGSWPASNNVYDFGSNLYNKVDMVTNDLHRGNFDHPKLPKRSGQLNNIDKFDAGFFGVHHKQAHAMDPMMRIVLEKTAEAIIDAGYHPSELAGSRTGVFMCLMFSETGGFWYRGNSKPQHSPITGCSKSMLAHRISYNLKLQGPSYNIENGCSSALTALEHAYKAIRNGECDRAIVGAGNFLLNPLVTLQFVRLGILSFDGICKTFDAKADGYARSEGIGVVMVQKSNGARRIYASIVHIKTNCDGFKQEGINFPASEMQAKLYDEIYKESNTNVDDITYIECHGTGTKVGDLQEVQGLDAVICRKRRVPLLVGSTKTNMGHCEGASGIASVCKVIVMMEKSCIPPNLHFSNVRDDLEALKSERMKVVDECVPLSENTNCLVGISGFGFSGSNAHALVQWNKKTKNNYGFPLDDIPRLVCISGRTKHSVPKILDDITNRRLDEEYIRLYHQVFSKEFQGHFYRGYSIVSKSGELERSIKAFVDEKLPLYLVFTKFGNCWSSIARELTKLPLLSATLNKIQNILIKKNIDITKIIEDEIENENNLSFNQIIGSAVLQIAIADLLKALKLCPEGVFGLGLGEFICGYFNECLTLEETVNCVCHVALLSCYQHSGSYSVNIPQSKLQLPLNVYISQNFDNGVIITGNPEKLKPFVLALTKQGALVEEVNDGENNYNHFRPELLQITTNFFKKGSSPWSSSSSRHLLTECFFDTKIELLTLNSKLKEPCQVFEIGKDQLQIVEKLEKAEYTEIKDLMSFIKILGRLFQNGHNCDLSVLYPEVQYPVGRGTPMISPLIEWDHTQDWYVIKESPLIVGNHTFSVDINNEDWKYISDHVVDGRNLFPATGYLSLVWDKFAQMLGAIKSDMQIIFENCKFIRPTHMSKDKPVIFTIMIQPGSGNFEVMEAGTLVATGKISVPQNFSQEHNIDFQISNDSPMLNTNDFYKELRLRGYNYTGEFCNVQKCSKNGFFGTVRWKNNWVTFVDNMMQLIIFHKNDRLLYVPTSIERISIDARKHLDLIQSCGGEPDLPVYTNKDSDTALSNAIEVRCIKTRPIARRRERKEPLLEKYHFVPNVTFLSLRESLRVNLQIVFENSQTKKMKIVELAESTDSTNLNILAPMIQEVLLEIPLVQTDVTVLHQLSAELFKISCQNQFNERNCYLVVGTNILKRNQILHQAFDYTKQNGYIMSRESHGSEIATLADVEILTTFFTGSEKIMLVKKRNNIIKSSILINIEDTDADFSWLPELQTHLKNQESVILYAQNQLESGLLGFVNCLRREPRTNQIRTVIINGDVPNFNPSDPFYEAQLKKGFAINIYKNSKWGTYRLSRLEPLDDVVREHCYVNITNIDDLSSLKWTEGPLTKNSQPQSDQQLIYVYYSTVDSLNVMVTKLVSKFAGRSTNGQRVMGLASGRGLSNMEMVNSNLLWPIPELWTMEEAVTVPLIYGTVIYALLMVIILGIVHFYKYHIINTTIKQRTTIRKGDSILIHSGCGDIGQAAITLALYFGCTVYTTVGTTEERQLLKRRFPQIENEYIGNSCYTNFEQMIYQQTNGRGVDFVLNSLVEENFEASVHCLAHGGKFLEIKNFDKITPKELPLLLMSKEASFHGIVLGQFCSTGSAHEMVTFNRIFADLLNKDVIRPITRTVYEANQLEEAFRSVTSGQRMGKILIKAREEEKEKICVPLPHGSSIKGTPRYICNPSDTCIIVGGLGGMGLELANWLVLRGAKHLVLTSRKGVQTSYQSYRIKIWKTAGVVICVSTTDVTTKQGCETLIKKANKLGQIESIFNVAVVLHDAIFENQDASTFKKALAPKAVTTKHLDEITRKTCPKLKNFVVFSSAVSARGNGGQTNYGMANSIIERICENRRRDGFPAVAIEWSAVGDVGIVAEQLKSGVEVVGTIPQAIASCLKVMDNFLKQNNPIVSSSVISGLREDADFGDTLIEVAANILGVKKLKAFGWHIAFSELGLDSMITEELKHAVKKKFHLFLTSKEIRNLTFSRVQELQDELLTTTDTMLTDDITRECQMLSRTMVSELTSNLTIVELKSKMLETTKKPLTIILFPGIDGVGKTLESVSINLNIKALSLQYCNGADTVAELVENLLPIVEETISKTEPFNFISYSFGTIIALEIVNLLEQRGYKGHLICIDGTPAMVKARFKKQHSTPQFQTHLLINLANILIDKEAVSSVQDAILRNGTLKEKLDKLEELHQKTKQRASNKWRSAFENLLKRFTFLKNYEPSYKIKSPVTLCKATDGFFPELPPDYGLSKLCEGSINVVDINGDHTKILKNRDLATAIEASFKIECNSNRN